MDKSLTGIHSFEKEVLEPVEPFSAQLALIRTLPGPNKDPMTDITILTEIGSDMSVFPTAKNPFFRADLCRFIRLPFCSWPVFGGTCFAMPCPLRKCFNLLFLF